MTKNDMTPVTRSELREELERFATKADIETRFATKLDLETWGRQLSAELAQHVNAMGESIRAQISTIDDQYKGLPARVARLEAAVFSPAPKRKRRSS